jgi:hypothetical protein
MEWIWRQLTYGKRLPLKKIHNDKKPSKILSAETVIASTHKDQFS